MTDLALELVHPARRGRSGLTTKKQRPQDQGIRCTPSSGLRRSMAHFLFRLKVKGLEFGVSIQGLEIFGLGFSVRGTEGVGLAGRTAAHLPSPSLPSGDLDQASTRSVAAR